MEKMFLLIIIEEISIAYINIFFDKIPARFLYSKIIQKDTHKRTKRFAMLLKEYRRLYS